MTEPKTVTVDSVQYAVADIPPDTRVKIQLFHAEQVALEKLAHEILRRQATVKGLGIDIRESLESVEPYHAAETRHIHRDSPGSSAKPTERQVRPDSEERGLRDWDLDALIN